MKLIVRGYGDGRLIFEDHMELVVDPNPLFVIRQLKRVTSFEKHMIELEFPEAPVEERFCRFGTDSSGMVNPVKMPNHMDN